MRSSPAWTRMAVTNDSNEPLVGAMPTLPFQRGWVRAKTSVGTSASGTFLLLATITRTRPVTPIQLPSSARYFESTEARISAGTGANSPRSSTAPRPPASWAKNRSAGEFWPSSEIWAANSGVAP